MPPSRAYRDVVSCVDVVSYVCSPCARGVESDVLEAEQAETRPTSSRPSVLRSRRLILFRCVGVIGVVGPGSPYSVRLVFIGDNEINILDFSFFVGRIGNNCTP